MVESIIRKKSKHRIKRNKFDITFDTINLGLLSIFLISILYPLIYIISASFSDPNAVVGGRMWLYPLGFTLEGYLKVFSSSEIGRGFLNSTIYTVVGTFINVSMTLMAAYPLSRKDFIGRNVFTIIFTITLFFSGGLIPIWIVVKSIGIYNSMWALILPSAVSMWNIIVMRTFFQSSIPGELWEAAKIDGCSNMNYLFKIIIPLAKPILAVMFLFYGVGQWNKFFEALIFLRDKELFPLQLILRDILIKNILAESMRDPMMTALQINRTSEIIKYCLIVVSSIPMIAIYPFLQKYFVKGVMIGAIKG
jgi:putative aldouronate transport system permease protein